MSVLVSFHYIAPVSFYKLSKFLINSEIIGLHCTE